MRSHVHMSTIINKILTKLINTYVFNYYFPYVVILSVLNLSLNCKSTQKNRKTSDTGILSQLALCDGNYIHICILSLQIFYRNENRAGKPPNGQFIASNSYQHIYQLDRLCGQLLPNKCNIQYPIIILMAIKLSRQALLPIEMPPNCCLSNRRIDFLMYVCSSVSQIIIYNLKNINFFNLVTH